MQDSLAIVGVALAAFVATNLDNLFFLIAFLADAKGRTLRVHAGFLLAIAGILLVGVGAAQAADFAPARYVGWLGIVPIALGLHSLERLRRDRAAPWPERPVERQAGAFTVALVTLANAGDSFAVFVPLFAESEDPFVVLIVATGLVAGILWCVLATWLVEHQALGHSFRRIGPRLLPFLMIGVGIYVLINTGSDTLF